VLRGALARRAYRAYQSQPTARSTGGAARARRGPGCDGVGKGLSLCAELRLLGAETPGAARCGRWGTRWTTP